MAADTRVDKVRQAALNVIAAVRSGQHDPRKAADLLGLSYDQDMIMAILERAASQSPPKPVMTDSFIPTEGFYWARKLTCTKPEIVKVWPHESGWRVDVVGCDENWPVADFTFASGPLEPPKEGI